MPTIISHGITGITVGKLFAKQKQPVRFWILAALCPILPDLDIIGFVLGIPYNHFLGHRGFFHSIFFAIFLSLIIMLIFYKDRTRFSRAWWIYFCLFSMITASHGILDTFTSGGLGVALFAPFHNLRYFSPWSPIAVSPIGVNAFFSQWGIRVLLSEIIWIWTPSAILLLISRLITSIKT